MITQPWQFEDLDSMNRWIAQFEQQARDICNRNGVPAYFTTIILHKNMGTPEVAIQRIGQFTRGSGEERAYTEIVKLFNQG